MPAYLFVSVMIFENVQFVHTRGVTARGAMVVAGNSTSICSPIVGVKESSPCNICLDRAETMWYTAILANVVF